MRSAATQAKGHGSQQKVGTDVALASKTSGTIPASTGEHGPTRYPGIAASVDAPALAAVVTCSHE